MNDFIKVSNDLQEELCKNWFYDFYNNLYEEVYINLSSENKEIWLIQNIYDKFYKVI